MLQSYQAEMESQKGGSNQMKEMAKEKGHSISGVPAWIEVLYDSTRTTQKNSDETASGLP
jgi:hypothetical protein